MPDDAGGGTTAGAVCQPPVPLATSEVLVVELVDQADHNCGDEDDDAGDDVDAALVDVSVAAIAVSGDVDVIGTLWDGYKASFWTCFGACLTSCLICAGGMRKLGKVGVKVD